MTRAINGSTPAVRQHPFLAGLPPPFYALFDECGALRRFAAQQVIFHEGAEADHFYLIVSGKVDLQTFIAGVGMVTIQELGSGDALGWSWLFPPATWRFTAATREATEVLSFDARKLRQTAEQNLPFHDELITRIAKTLNQRLLSTRAQLVQFYNHQL